jgi:hypothetical protein
MGVVPSDRVTCPAIVPAGALTDMPTAVEVVVAPLLSVAFAVKL